MPAAWMIMGEPLHLGPSGSLHFVSNALGESYRSEGIPDIFVRTPVSSPHLHSSWLAVMHSVRNRIAGHAGESTRAALQDATGRIYAGGASCSPHGPPRTFQGMLCRGGGN